MQDMNANSMAYMVFKLVISFEQGTKNKPLDIAWCALWSLKQKEVLNLLLKVLTLNHIIPVTEGTFCIYHIVC